MVMLWRWPVERRGNFHVTLMEGEWSCYRSGQFNERIMVMLRRWPV